MGAVLKKMLVCLMGFLLFAGQCFAMNFSEIERLGVVGGTPQGGIGIEGASYNNGTSYMDGRLDKQWKEKLYEKGTARFGTGDNALWMYYDCSEDNVGRYEDAYSAIFGDKEKKVTVRLMLYTFT